MSMTKKHDWGLVVAGILLVVCAGFIMVAPGLALVTLTAIAGAGFLVSGIFDAVSYARFRSAMNMSGWVLAYAILDIVLGLMLLLHPLAFAGVIPWIVGLFFVVFGVFEIAGALSARRMGMTLWAWLLFSGIVEVLCGLMFFLMPTMLVVFLALFIVMRGVTLVFAGWNADRMLV